MTTPADTSGLIKSFTGTVGSNGIAVVTITQSIHGLAWIILQVGFALNEVASSPQVAAHVNGIPLAATVNMQVSAFANVTGNTPYAMESFMVGPPYVTLEAGDQMVCAVTGATPGDTFTVGAYVNEIPSPAMTRAQRGY
jgi:hypothetical protein